MNVAPSTDHTRNPFDSELFDAVIAGTDQLDKSDKDTPEMAFLDGVVAAAGRAARIVAERGAHQPAPVIPDGWRLVSVQMFGGPYYQCLLARGDYLAPNHEVIGAVGDNWLEAMVDAIAEAEASR